jgi:tetratricopeptide (TPR) repeat protein
MPSSFHESTSTLPQSPSVLAVLLQIHRAKKTGLLRLMQGTALLRVWFESGTVHHANGFEGIFSKCVAVDPPGGFSGDLMHDVGQVIALGVAPQVVLCAAHEGIVGVLVQVALSGDLGWGFQEGEPAPPGAMPLPGVLLKEVIHSLEQRFTSAELRERFKGKKGDRLQVLGELLPSDGFPPLTLRVFRLAAKDLSLQAVLDSLGGGDPGREHTALKCIALLLELGLVALVPAPGASEIPVRREEDFSEKLPPSEETTEKIDTPYKGESLSERRRARASLRRSSPRISESTSSGPEPEKPTPPAAQPSIPDDPQWFVDKAVELAEMNPLLALGLDPAEIKGPIRLDMVRAAFRKQAAVFHPDRLGSFSTESKEAAENVFSALSALRDYFDSQAVIDRVAKQLERKRSGVKEITAFDREKALVSGRKAEGLMRHRKWQAAQESLAQALAFDPENQLMVLRKHFCSGLLKEVPFVQAATAVEAIEVNGKKAQAERLYRAGWLWRLGDKNAKALRCLENALGLEPGHLEVKSELRMLKKRMGENEEKSERTLPFARFFKKK